YGERSELFQIEKIRRGNCSIKQNFPESESLKNYDEYNFIN
ncbi:MAG: hypothetical protein UZ05_CHB002001505, partial [Chlorobi bacterium OLB5]